LAIYLCTELRSHFRHVTAGGTDESRLNELKRHGCNVKKYDFSNPESIKEAYKQHDIVILISPLHEGGDNKSYGRVLIECVNKASVKSAMLMSVEAAEKCNSPAIKLIYEMEQMLGQQRALECWAILRTSFIMQSLLHLRTSIQQKRELPLCTGDKKFAPVSLHDVGNTIAAMASKKDTSIEDHHRGKTYLLTGKDLVTGRDVASVASRALQSEIHFRPVSKSEFEQCIRENGKASHMEPELLAAMCNMVNEGTAGKKTDDVERLTGRKPTGLNEFFEKHEGDFAPKQ